MRSNLKLYPHSGQKNAAPVAAMLYRLATGSDREDNDPGEPSLHPRPTEHEDLPYKVELWDEANAAVEQVLAVTASGSIGYAAYYAATREFPHRSITLRHRNSILSRWDGRGH